jgi:hypothetical protein
MYYWLQIDYRDQSKSVPSYNLRDM